MTTTQTKQSPMKIPSLGNYLTEDKQTAIVDTMGHCLCSGRVEPGYPYVVWDRDTGQAFTPPGGTANSLSIVSPAPIPWRERIIQLIETAKPMERPSSVYSLANGDLWIGRTTLGAGGCLVVSKNGERLFLHSPELLGALDARLAELRSAAVRAMDDANSAAIEALLQ